VSLSREVRASELATSCTPESCRSPASDSGDVLALSCSTTTFSVAGSRSAANVVRAASDDHARSPTVFQASAIDWTERQLRSKRTICLPAAGRLRVIAASYFFASSFVESTTTL